MRGANFSQYKAFIPGEIFTASDANSMQSTIISNLDLSGIGSYFTNNTEFGTTADPYPSGSPSIPSTALVWAHYVHYQFLQLLTKIATLTGGTVPTYWWEDPVSDTISLSDSVTSKSADYILTAANCNGRTTFTNSAAVKFTLPAATAGLMVEFEINHSGGIKFARTGSDTFSIGVTTGLTACPVGGTAYDVIVGGKYKAICLVAGVWTLRRYGVQPRFLASITTDYTINSGADRLVAFDIEEVDNNAEYDNATNYKYTPLIPGIYDVTIQCEISAFPVSFSSLKAFIDGASFKSLRCDNPGASTIRLPVTIHFEYVFTGTTYLQAYANFGTTAVIQSGGATDAAFSAIRRAD